MWESCTKMLVSVAVRMVFTFLCCCRTCFFLVFFSFDQVRALFRQSFPCQLVAAAGAATAAASVRCRRPTVLTPMLTQSSNTPSVCLHATVRHAPSFNFLCFCFIKCAICFCCRCVFSFSLCFCVLPFFLCFSFFCDGGILNYFDDFLLSFSSWGISILMFFQLEYFFHVFWCHVFLPYCYD